MKIKEVTYNNEIISEIFSLDEIPEGLTFLSQDERFIQFGTWNYKKGQLLDAHFHNTFDRTSNITQEIVIVLKGSLSCKLYNKNKDLIDELIVRENQFIVQYSLVHEYMVIEDSIVLEVKNGPYFGPDKDRTRV
jgi:hypothetical protein|tara:strand:+ start:17305 stop:17706 length:402 start_codon:yes stop_codon:yes gene_type:complete